jgi:hypothetical protein
MDITDALAPTSDQLDAVELVNPRTFTIDTGSALGKREGKTVAEIRLVDFPRVWRPSKGMLDVLAACWTTDAKQWVGHRVTVYNDPDVMFGRDKTGGVRISHLSHIDKARSVTIRASGAGKKQSWHVEPLPDTTPARPPVEPTAEDVATCTDPAVLRGMWKTSGPERRAQITARVAELAALTPTPPADDESWGSAGGAA